MAEGARTVGTSESRSVSYKTKLELIIHPLDFRAYRFDGTRVRVLCFGLCRLVEIKIFAAVKRVQGLKSS